MEVKINREIRDYTESMFFGLSMRQFFFSLGALAVAVAVYLTLKPVIGLETVSWVCILAAVPFAVMGFVRYNGMPAEKFIWAWLRSEMLEPRELKFVGRNYYHDMTDTGDSSREKTKTNNESEKATANGGGKDN